MTTPIRRATLIPSKEGFYAAFPTACVVGDEVHIFYRLGLKGAPRTHGHGGCVRQLSLSRFALMRMLEESCAALNGQDRALFAEANEMDAIVTDYGDSRFTLATRTFREGLSGMVSYLAQSASPHFSAREAVAIEGVAWLVFYGHGFLWQGQRLLPAYGGLQGDGRLMRPLLIALPPDGVPQLFAAFPYATETLMFNESSLVEGPDGWQIFMRRHRSPHGIWHSQTRDFQQWHEPEFLVEAAQAPMARRFHGRTYLVFRKILGEDEAALALLDLESGQCEELDRYRGNIYDGGYGDLFVLDDQLYGVYYHGNPAGEPSLKLVGPLR